MKWYAKRLATTPAGKVTRPGIGRRPKCAGSVRRYPGGLSAGAERECAVPEDSYRSAHTLAFDQGAKDFPPATGGSLEAIRDRAIADAEFCLAGLALEILDVLLASVGTAADKSVDLFIGDAVVKAVGVRTSIPSRRDPLFAASQVYYPSIWDGKNG